MNKSLLIWLFVSLLVGQSCKSSREATAGAADLPNRKTAELVELLKSSDQKCDWTNIKYYVEIKTNKIDDSFKLYVRSRLDSAIWVSATYYAVEVARFLFTPDSVKFMDRRNNQYYVGGYEYITNTFMVDADFWTLQDLIMGNGSAFVDSRDEKLYSSENDGSYKISYFKDSQIRRAMKKDENKGVSDLAVSLVLDPSSFRVETTTILDIEDERSLTVNYSNHKPLCETTHPHTTIFSAESPNEQATVKTSIIKISSGKRVSLSFTIPDKYEPLAP
jgi:hypothetical protein